MFCGFNGHVKFLTGTATEATVTATLSTFTGNTNSGTKRCFRTGVLLCTGLAITRTHTTLGFTYFFKTNITCFHTGYTKEKLKGYNFIFE